MWGRGEKSVQSFGGNTKGKKPLGRLRHRWKDGIRMDIREISYGDMEWIRLAQDRDRCRAVVNAVLELRLLAPRSQFDSPSYLMYLQAILVPILTRMN
jgi:hypothetical protein